MLLQANPVNRQGTSYTSEVVLGARAHQRPFSGSQYASQNALSPQNLQTTILTSLEDMAGFEAQWRALENAAATPANVFQSFDWCYNWVKTLASDNECYGIYIIAISVNGQCQLIWPMMTACSGPFHILRWLSEPYSQYGDVLAVQNPKTPALLKSAWQTLRNHPFADSIRLRHVRKTAIVADFLSQHARHDGHVDYAPFLEIQKFPTEQAYEARYTKSQRRRRKRIAKNLAQNGPLEFSISSGGETFAKRFNAALAEKQKWLAERGLYSKPLMSDGLDEFFNALANNGRTLETRASLLKSGEREISWEIGLRFKDHHFGYITAHKKELTDASPGRLHMDYSQREAIKDGLAAFDLMVPGDPHKKTWSSAQIETRDYFTHLSIRGALYTQVYLNAVRPAIRWAYLTVPANIRRYFTGLFS